MTASDGLDDDGLYVIPDLPVYRRADASMSGKDIRVFAPHDAIAEEVASTPSMKFELAKRISDLDSPAVYFNHRLYAETGEALYPMALYVDAVAFSRTDKIVGFWLENLITRVRSLLVVLRHALFCRCGCRGNCTLHPIMTFLS